MLEPKSSNKVFFQENCRMSRFQSLIDQPVLRMQKDSRATSLRLRNREDMLHDYRLVDSRQKSEEEENEVKQMCENIKLLSSPDFSVMSNALSSLKKYLSNTTSRDVRFIFRTDAIHTFIRLMNQDENPSVQLNAAWCLSNIVALTNEKTHIDYIAYSGAVASLLKLTRSKHKDVVHQALWGLRNFSVEFRHLLVYVVDEGAALACAVAYSTHSEDNEICMMIAKLISIITFEQANNPAVEPAFGVICRLLKEKKCSIPKVMKKVALALRYLTTGSNKYCQLIIAEGLLPMLISFCQDVPISVATNLFYVFGSITCGANSQTEALISANFIPLFAQSLFIPDEELLEEAFFASSNICKGESRFIEEVVNAGLVDAVCAVLVSRGWKEILRTPPIGKEASGRLVTSALHIVLSLAFSEASFIEILLSKKVIAILSHFINSDNVQWAELALQIIHHLLLFGEATADLVRNSVLFGEKELDPESDRKMKMFNYNTCLWEFYLCGGKDITQQIALESKNQAIRNYAIKILENFVDKLESSRCYGCESQPHEIAQLSVEEDLSASQSQSAANSVITDDAITTSSSTTPSPPCLSAGAPSEMDMMNPFSSQSASSVPLSPLSNSPSLKSTPSSNSLDTSSATTLPPVVTPSGTVFDRKTISMRNYVSILDQWQNG
ncbi:putative importin subunit alpha-1 [Monocercomonoides exilis]|uniref:putative importin subunit alpha-1 n=1 Tax=Monocercomonoides exilis TaxID=2049356 RepID=UPI003559FE15|nr:putative importin subunit alpha-1 [Monocercomonoides exilis]